MSNRLAHETSPYLLQHRDNPVDWWPWGPEALAAAQRMNRPILLSIGYAACHWCHVMAHESFEDAEIAALMNALYINIKVDREERPDIDHIYMTALHQLGEQGGWPLTMFLTPKGEPFWGGTYFPKTARYGKPAFATVLHDLARIFHDSPDKIEQNRAAIAERLALTATRSGPAGRPGERAVLGPAEMEAFASALVEAMDPVNGGLKGAPKFPQCTILEVLLRSAIRPRDAAKQVAMSQAVDLALERMARGGIYDHLAGGFARYSTDAAWLVPHFEKMLYDNAQLLDLYTLVWQRGGNPLFADRVRHTISWLLDEMRQPGGGFASSLDADSEGEEGRFYVWSLDEITRVLGAENAALFAAYYDVSAGGNFEGKNILNQLNRLPEDAATAERLAMLRDLLQQERSKRVRPGLDDKILADWNGLTISALIHAATAFSRPEWLNAAQQAYGFVRRNMIRDDRLGHSWREGRLLFPGLSSDYAAMIQAALALHEATGEPSALADAVAWQQALERHHADPQSGGYFLSADDAEGLILRPLVTTDDAIVNPHALIAQNLVRLSAVTGDPNYRARAEALFDGLLPEAARLPFAHAGLLNAYDFAGHAVEIVITGEDETAERLAATARAFPHLNRILLRVAARAALPAHHPARAAAGEDQSAAYVCKDQACRLPVTTAEALTELLATV